MKHSLLRLSILALLLAAKTVVFAGVGDFFNFGGLYYSITSEENKTVKVIGQIRYTGDIVIPEKVEYQNVTYTVNEIGSYAFYCNSISSVVIPNTIETIGNDAFYNCKLPKIVLGEGVKYIGDYAFQRCNYLETVVLPNSLISTGKNVFEDCDKIKSITLPDNLTEIDYGCFYGCDELEEITIGVNVEKVGDNSFRYCKKLKTLKFGENVSSLGTNAFGSCTSLNSVLLPNSLKEIGQSAFDGCTELSEISFGENISVIGLYSFRGCTKITEINIPNSVTTIGTSAFYGCVGIKRVSIGNGVTSLGVRAFENCPNLEKLEINCPAISKCFSNIPSIKELILGDDVITLESNAFDGCTGLKSVMFGKGIESVGKDAFAKCNSVEVAYFSCKNINRWFPSNRKLKEIIIEEGVENIGNSTFEGNAASTLSLPNSLKTIGESAFYKSTVSKLSLGEGVKTIGKYAFKSCEELTEITIPNSIEKIDMEVFYGCKNLRTAIFHCDSIGRGWLKNCLISEILLGNEVRVIGKEAFYNLDITEITIPNSVETIGDGAFYGCKKLSSIHIPSNVKSIGNQAFYVCYSLKSITMEEGVTTIGDEAFIVGEIDSIIIPNSVKSIGERAFKKVHYVVVGSGAEKIGKNFVEYSDSILFHCSINNHITLNTTKLIFSEGCKSICRGAFSQCPIEEVRLGNAIESIEYRAFYKCNIREIDFPSSLKIIGEEAFRGNSIGDIVIPPSVTKIGSHAFASQYVYKDTINVVLEDGSEELRIDNWAFGTTTYNIRENNTYNVYNLYLGRNCISNMDYAFPQEQVVKVVMGDLVTLIPDFPEFKNLYYFHASKSGTNIGTFSKCTNLKSINIPSAVTQIPNRCFYGCSSLKHIDIPDNVTKIGEEAFMYSHVIYTHLIIPSSVQEIGDQAFAGLSGDSIIFVSSIPPHIPHYTFANAYHSNSTIYVPRGSVGAYLHADGDPTLIAPPTVTGPDDKGRIYYYSRYFVNCRFTEYDNIEDIFSGTISPSHIDNTTINIENNNDIFDLRGIKVGSNKKPKKGIYIKNGKKVIIK